MADLNNFTFTGRLGSDATVNKLSSGKSVMEMSVAINSGFGNYKRTTWAKVKVWGDRVNNIVGIFKKGDLVGGSGEIELNSWTGNDGTSHTDLIVTCSNVQVLSSKEKKTSEQVDSEVEF